jgi:transposase InsO family protein
MDKFQPGSRLSLSPLQKQDIYTLHKPVRYRVRRNRVIVGAMDDEWEADLVIMDSLSQQNNGYKYVLTVIDVLSKYAWVEARKAKTGGNLVKSFGKIIKKGRKPKMFHTDKGAEFINKQFQTFLKKHDIRFFSTYNETKTSIVEMFNRTLKTKMWRYFTANNTLKYVDILQKSVSTS